MMRPRTIFFGSLFVHTLLFFWMYDMDRKASRLEREAALLADQEAAA